MVKYLPLSAGMLNLCSNTPFSGDDREPAFGISDTSRIGLDPATCGRFSSAEARRGEYKAGGLIRGLGLIDRRLRRRH